MNLEQAARVLHVLLNDPGSKEPVGFVLVTVQRDATNPEEAKLNITSNMDAKGQQSILKNAVGSLDEKGTKQVFPK
jgi:hypothetical protein